MMITDRFGRRSLLVYSMTSMGICLLGLSHYFFAKKYNPRIADSLDWLPLVAIVLYVSMYSIGCGPIPYILIGEVFSSEVSVLLTRRREEKKNVSESVVSNVEDRRFFCFFFCFVAQIDGHGHVHSHQLDIRVDSDVSGQPYGHVYRAERDVFRVFLVLLSGHAVRRQPRARDEKPIVSRNPNRTRK